MSDEFTPILAGRVLHAAPPRVIIVRDVRNRAYVRTICDQVITYPGPDWREAKRVCRHCLPGETLDDLLATNNAKGN